MPTKTKFQQLVKNIERSNKKFEKASSAEKIVMVSKDVLAMLALRRIKAHSGIYVELPSSSEKLLDGLKDMSELLKLQALPSCEVCAIGASMFATTLRLDNVPVLHDYLGKPVLDADYSSPGDYARSSLSSGMSERAREVFPHHLLRQMENAFENHDYGYAGAPGKRLADIYKNLVKNKGEKFTNRETGEEIWSYVEQ